MTNHLLDAEKAKRFILAGNARVTLVSLKTDARYTYRVQQAGDKPDMWFVYLLTGSDNESDFTYIGIISGFSFRTTNKSKLPADSAPVAGFSYAMKALLLQTVPQIPSSLQIWHEGRCGRCNRALTVPESILSGFGPECAKR